ncbi:DUF4258 domain-containing protein [Acaricomes phytoseiuli]|uniref:DUF4258 domain-containing protein n=1 Tax=Acaricomes phytoseiuli TaxID=291968 RepID=UPI003872E70E
MYALKITSHALRRMSERGVTEADIQQALATPTMSMPGRPTGVTYIGPTVGKQRLAVCVVEPLERDKLVTIKSLYWRGR